MEPELFQQITFLFNTIEKNAEDRYQYIQDNFLAIRKQQEGSKQERKEIQKAIQQFKIRELTHAQNCPFNDKLDKLETKVDLNKKQYDDESLTSRFYSKNPNIFIGAVAIGVFLLFVSVIGGYYTLRVGQQETSDKVTNIENMQKKEAKQTDAVYKKEIDSINQKEGGK